MRIGICEFTTMRAGFEDDLTAYRAAGVSGIGVLEAKLPTDGAALLRASGLRATACIPAVPSILPLPPLPGPERPEERVEALCASVHRLAALEPECVLFLTGPGEERREAVLEGVRRVAEAARQAGVRVALEPVHLSQRDAFSFVHSVPEAIALLAEAEAPDVGLLVDAWHLGDDPGQVEAAVGRIYGVHVADRREPTRNLFDRVLPGDGVLALGEFLRAVGEAGYEGWYDVEIFSDESFPDSLWTAEPGELASRARASMEALL
jgi:sugar phosphate isomerase/epimerase